MKQKEGAAPRWSDYLTDQMLDTHERLENWGRWGRDSLGGKHHCGSAEHKYVPTRDDEKEEKQSRQSTEGVDVLDAEAVEAVCASIPMRSFERAFLKSHYVKRHPWKGTCQRLRIGQEFFKNAHIRTVTLVGALLHAKGGASQIARRRAILASTTGPATSRRVRTPSSGAF